MWQWRNWVPAIGVASLYYLGGTLAVLQTRFDGGFAFIWIASAVLLAHLLATPRKQWAAGLILCGVASVAVTGFFGLGWAYTAPLLVANLIEVIAAALMIRAGRSADDTADPVHRLGRFVMAVAGPAALAGAMIAGLSLHLIAGFAVLPSVLNWYTGHVLGFLTFTPVFSLIFSGEIVRRWQAASRGQIAEIVGLMLLVSGVAVGVFSQSSLPLLFLPILPIILATFRAGQIGAGLSIVLLSMIAAGFTIAGRGPVSLVHGDIATHARFLQFYLAATVMTILPVSFELARRRRLLRALQNSEARYRALADHSSDIIMNLDVDGRIRFASPAIFQLAGYFPDELVGRGSTELIDPEHVEAVRTAHVRALMRDGGEQRVEYLGLLRNGDRRWFETRTRAVRDENGRATGVVSVIRDVHERKTLEASLADAAIRDPLTGVLNRRGFMRELEAAEGGCLALFDLDHFKRVNDSFGHAAGDAVLKMFAQTAGRMVRAGDHVGRMGGEEFAVLLKGASLEQAQTVCERLREAVAARACLYDHRRIWVTVSGGVTVLQGNATAALNAADEALYAAKAGGRDRLALAA
jgi:diguanylate cyclase (GGDEF)-like protein/PAS domain S-box-containing protein